MEKNDVVIMWLRKENNTFIIIILDDINIGFLFINYKVTYLLSYKVQNI